MQSDAVEVTGNLAGDFGADIEGNSAHTRARGLRGRLARFVQRRRAAIRAVALVATLFFVLQVLGSDALPGNLETRYAVRAATQGWGFDLLGWEVQALRAKAGAALNNPAAHLDDAAGSALVRAYLARGEQIVALDAAVNEALAAGSAEAIASSNALLEEVAALRATQAAQRPIAEAVIERQITTILEEMGIGVMRRVMPPVVFSFSESPRKLVVSPRTVIASVESRMLNPGMPLDVVEQTEDALAARGDVSVYIADTGGLGAFPTIVVDDAPLPWILSTVAHEWVHTYLAFFPLGFTYGSSPDNTTINESVADIVGDEVGARALARFYPELAPVAVPAEAIEEGALAAEAAVRARPLAFDFFAEMRHTRETVDKFLRVGRVKDAERYMELRRILFVEAGYPLRTLNQAYFAFHGSYGTGPAADVSSPDAVAPLVTTLRDLVAQFAHSNDTATFLRTVRSIRDRAGLEKLVEQWAAL